MSHYFYITPEEYEIAASNGVSSVLLETRIRQLAWKKERALITPPQKKNDRREWSLIARGNGITYGTFLRRVNHFGMSNEEAATKPLLDRKKNIDAARQHQLKYPPEMVALALSNGIKYMTFRKRLKVGWDINEAATHPVMTHSEIGLLTKDTRMKGIRRLFVKV